MTRLPFTTIAYVCTTRTDTQNAHYPIRDGQSSGFNCSGIIHDGLVLWMQQKACLANSVP